jgi:hypothetical protein
MAEVAVYEVTARGIIDKDIRRSVAGAPGLA